MTLGNMRKLGVHRPRCLLLKSIMQALRGDILDDAAECWARTINNKIRLYRAQGYEIPEPKRGIAKKKPESALELAENVS